MRRMEKGNLPKKEEKEENDQKRKEKRKKRKGIISFQEGIHLGDIPRHPSKRGERVLRSL